MMGKKLTKIELIDQVYEKTGMIRKDIKAVVDLAFEEIKQALADGMIIELRGFGTFEVRRRKGRIKARNPRTGEAVSVIRHGIAAFRAGRELKQAVWNIEDNTEDNEDAGVKEEKTAGSAPLAP